MADELRVEHRGAIRILTLNRPESFNAANPALHGRLAQIWPEHAADPEAASFLEPAFQANLARMRTGKKTPA